MRRAPSIGRYYTYQALFAFSMMGLVLAPNFVQLFISWELVGLCSYLLIGFWYHKPEAARAAVKAFWITKAGDIGLLVGDRAAVAAIGHVRPDRDARDGRERRPTDRRALPDHVLHLSRRCRQVRAVSAACLASGCHGRANAGLGAHSRGDDGHRRGVLAAANRVAVRADPGRAPDRGLGGRLHRAPGGRPGVRPGRHQARSRLFHRLAASAT